MLRGDLAGRGAGGADADTVSLDQRHSGAVALEQERSGETGDARPHHGHVDVEVVFESRE